MTQGGTLNFKSTRNHSGKYLCLAENGLDVTVNASAYLVVQCKYEYGRIVKQETVAIIL